MQSLDSCPTASGDMSAIVGDIARLEAEKARRLREVNDMKASEAVFHSCISLAMNLVS